MVIQIDAIDTVHILVADILAHAREDSPSQVMVFNVHDIAIRILIYGISQGTLALQHHREDGFLVDDSHIESLIRSAVGIGLHDFIDKFLQCHIHSHITRCQARCDTECDRGVPCHIRTYSPDSNSPRTVSGSGTVCDIIC